MGKHVPIYLRIDNPFSNNWFCLIGFIACVLHPLIWLVMRLIFQILYKLIPIYFLFKRLFLKFYTNGFPYIFFPQKLFFSSSLQISAHVFFSQDLYETTSCRYNSWTNQICSKLHKINPSFKFHQELFSLNKSIASQPNSFKSTKFEALAWNQMCFRNFMEILE